MANAEVCWIFATLYHILLTQFLNPTAELNWLETLVKTINLTVWLLGLDLHRVFPNDKPGLGLLTWWFGGRTITLKRGLWIADLRRFLRNLMRFCQSCMQKTAPNAANLWAYRPPLLCIWRKWKQGAWRCWMPWLVGMRGVPQAWQWNMTFWFDEFLINLVGALTRGPPWLPKV